MILSILVPVCPVSLTDTEVKIMRGGLLALEKAITIMTDVTLEEIRG